MDWLHPDGEFSDQERARKRGIMLGKQEFDGMSRLSGLVTPELRAAIEAMLAKLAAPGACNPDDETPAVDATPDEDAVRRDHRSQAQRNHDAFLAGMRGLFASGRVGPTQRPAGVDRGEHDAAGPGGRHRQGPDRRGHPGADVGCDPLGQPRPSLPGDLRSRQALGAVSHQTAGLPRTANHALRQGSVDAPSRAATHPPTTARSTTSKAGPRPAAPTSTTSPWPADRTTGSPKKAGPPAPTPKATPNGYRRRTWITGNHASTPSITPKNSWHPTTTNPFDGGNDCEIAIHDLEAGHRLSRAS